MKLRATKKEMRQHVSFAFGYCRIQALTRYKDAFAYSSGIYGWACDYYNIDGVIICTGYDPIGKIIESDNLTLIKYVKKAEAIGKKHIDYKTASSKINELLTQFIKELQKEAA